MQQRSDFVLLNLFACLALYGQSASTAAAATGRPRQERVLPNDVAAAEQSLGVPKTLLSIPDPDRTRIVDLGPAEPLQLRPTAPTGTSEWRRRREKVAAYMWLEARLRDLNHDLDENNFAKNTAIMEAKLGGDTGLTSTAQVLSKMRKQMHNFAAPLFREVVTDEIHKVRTQRRMLLQELADEAADADSSVRRFSAERPSPAAKSDLVHSAAATPRLQATWLLVLLVAWLRGM
mmetsp:Transcript_36431/g.72509  ORF Transcript_36431/g.72509 Transcript_36431/m.72509 type:complete len:233 (+) Transcript_36431:69-767(+)|eukprot:CAMPEP_0170273386 /NCGR_PEP_ID=MMETSP0116_2-20130129/36656_1 /TAXON_ID=400756 /ORGANISM="Durinskia baltica, Strain CSIRO CS-38" /LENGTH=232 /DNA_ID=CAMNT_0010524615 /DNA_START=86 /DNA_END=784 /DNA_ORIENTATION=-